MQRIYPLVTFFLYFFIFPAWGDQLIIEPDMGRAPIINAINDTQYTLNLVMYGFTDQLLLEAILNKKLHGKTVKIILEQRPYKAENENNTTLAAFESHHVAWQGSIPPLRFIHQKTLIIDNRKALIMTFNFTHSTFKNERNFAVITDDPKQVQAINAMFSADWNHVPTHHQAADLIVSPDNSRQKLSTLISQAKHTIQIYAQSISDYNMVGALAKAARAGVKVTIITSGKIRQKQADYLARARITIHQSKHLFIHAKAFIFDHQKAVIGSINLTSGSLDNNRELAILTQDRQVVEALEKTFNHDMQDTDTDISSQPAFTLDQATMIQATKMLKTILKPLQQLMRKTTHQKRYKHKKQHLHT